MIQRIIYTALSQGLLAIQADPTLLRDLFGDLYGLSDKEVAGIITLFKNQLPVVRHNYPHADIKSPVYAIVLESEEQSDLYLSDNAGTIGTGDCDTNGGLNIGAERLGAIWNHNYQILCYAEHPDVTTYMYEVAKSVFQAADDYFLQQDILEWNFAGMDLMPDPRYIPENLFCRAMTMTCKREFMRIDLASRLGRAFAVTGIAVPAGSPQDNGGALTLLTPFTQGATDGE